MKIINLLLICAMAASMTSCAVASGIAGGSIISYTSESLTSSGEAKLIEKIKKDIQKEESIHGAE